MEKCFVGLEIDSAYCFPNSAEEELYATVGMKGVGCSLTVNFGKSPLLFDLSSLIKVTKANIVQ